MSATINTVQILVARVRDALQEGRPERGERLLREHLAVAPGDETANVLLGICLQQMGRNGEAAVVYRDLTAVDPSSHHHWNNLGTALREDGRLREAEEAYLSALPLAGESAILLANLGYLYLDLGDLQNAGTYLLRAAEADPAAIEPRVFGAKAFQQCGNTVLAERLLQPWPTWRDLDVELEAELSWILFLLDHVDAGERMLRNVLARGYEPALAGARLVVLLERSNRLDEARALFDSLPSAGATADAEARTALTNAEAALMTRNSDQAAALAWFERLVARKLDGGETPAPADYFHLAKICDKRNDTEAAMAWLERAHAAQLEFALQLAPALRDPSAQPLQPSTIRLQSDEYVRWPELPAPARDESPIFIVGFPRSGTTLLEQMLDAHPSLKSMDERLYLAELADLAEERYALRYPHELDRLTKSQCDELRAHYWRRVAESVRLERGQRLVDKNPLNMLHVPLLKRLFPNAKLILALRHPCDILLSCYMQNFGLPAFMVMCSSLERLADGYTSAMRYWDHHATLVRPDWLPLRYEDLVGDCETSLRRLGDFLGLDDVSPMRQFDTHARNKGYIGTPSYHQVIQPLNSGSIGRWRRYADRFEPVLPILQPVLDAWNYDR